MIAQPQFSARDSLAGNGRPVNATAAAGNSSPLSAEEIVLQQIHLLQLPHRRADLFAHVREGEQIIRLRAAASPIATSGTGNATVTARFSSVSDISS
jgi:hypothetical protein